MAKTSPQERLRRWRGDRTVTLVAGLLYCHPSYVRLLERGKRFPGRDLAACLERIAKIPADSWGAK